MKNEVNYKIIKAIKSFKILINVINPLENENDIIEIITKLISNEWYTQKITAISLISIIIPFVSSENKNLLTHYIVKLSDDDNSYVKKELCSNLKVKFNFNKDFFGLIEDKIYISLIQKYLKDENDNIKLYIIDNLIVIKNKDLTILSGSIINIIKEIANNDLWKVRITFADKINEV